MLSGTVQGAHPPRRRYTVVGFVLAVGLAVATAPANYDSTRVDRLTNETAVSLDAASILETVFGVDPVTPAPATCSADRPWIATPRVAPVDGWFSDGFKWRTDPIHGGRRFHRGIDIVAPVGTEIRAPADGIVTRAGRNGGYGKMIELDHMFGHRTLFAHLDSYEVTEGETVRMGDVIGRVGITGKTSGPHLHYEVFDGTRRVNPWPYLGLR